MTTNWQVVSGCEVASVCGTHTYARFISCALWRVTNLMITQCWVVSSKQSNLTVCQSGPPTTDAVESGGHICPGVQVTVIHLKWAATQNSSPLVCLFNCHKLAQPQIDDFNTLAQHCTKVACVGCWGFSVGHTYMLEPLPMLVLHAVTAVLPCLWVPTCQTAPCGPLASVHTCRTFQPFSLPGGWGNITLPSFPPGPSSWKH